jgi:uncharacterized repeat protein (TIGR03803 family)
VLYSFGPLGKLGDGNRPLSVLRDAGGDLYGTTVYGGTATNRCSRGCGTLFRVDARGREHVVYRFKGGRDGAAPLAGVVIDGALYGTTSAGGGAAACTGGCGTVFKVSANGTSESVLHAFAGGGDGAAPAAELARAGGILYGTTQYGGHDTRLCPNGCGTVFSVRSDGVERVLYRFKGGKDGANPVARLYASGGRLYGTTQYGGQSTSFCATGCGTVFEINAAGVEKPLYAFRYSPSSNDGAFPAAGLVAIRGKLYGTTIGGGRYADGTVFAVDASSGDERVVHAFSCCSTTTDGQFPVADLIVANGILFGTTRNGGVSGQGTVFEVRGSGVETVLHDFGGTPDGATPSAGLATLGKKLYGTAAGGGMRSKGAVFVLAR